MAGKDPLAADSATPTTQTSHHGHAASRFWPLALGSVGVVFGDIGTSPLYAFRDALVARAAKVLVG